MFKSRKIGWIGVDIGTSSVKVVQLVRAQGGPRIAASAVIARRDVWPTDELAESEARSSADELSTLHSLRSDLKGRRVAASLPMALSDIHVLQETFTTSDKAQRAVRQAIETATQRSAEHLLFDHWTVVPAESGGNSGKTNVLTVPASWSDQLCQDISQTGWSCKGIDGLPFSLARAVAMTQPDTASGLVAALDLGYGRATLCVIDRGYPIYTRFLKDCALEQILTTLSDDLNLNRQEAEQLLQQHGLPVGADSDPQDDKSELIAKVLAAPLAQLEQEIARSIEHFRAQRRCGDPIRISLFGGGATIKNLDEYLSSRLRTSVQVWRLNDNEPQQESGLPDCLLGPAVALSALAWEAV